MDPKHAVCLVTGAAGGIGSAVARALLDAGAVVWLAGRDAARLQALEKTLDAPARTRVQAADVRDERSVQALFDAVVERDGRLDLLVNNAGTVAGAPADELALADWQRVIDVNLTGAFLCSREALRLMKRQGGGRIVNVGSISAHVPRAGSAAYTASKFGLDGLTRAFALDARAHGVAVSILHPGNTRSGFWDGRDEMAAREGIMPAAEVARVLLAMVSLPDDINLLEATMLPLSMPFLGRG